MEVLNQKEWITTGQAANLLQCPKRTVRRYVHDGKIVSEQHPITGRWKVSVASVQSIITTYKTKNDVSTSCESFEKIDNFPNYKNGLEKSIELIQKRINYWKKLKGKIDAKAIAVNVKGLQDTAAYLQYVLNQHM